MNNPQKTNVATGTRQPQQVDLASESVAGEEDPGASMDMSGSSPGVEALPASGVQPFALQGQLSPGDEAPAGTPGSGENICRECGGSGRVSGGLCTVCGGAGTVTVGLGGG